MNYGPTVAVVPSVLLPNWLIEWNRFVDSRAMPTGYQPRLIGGHPSLTKSVEVHINGKETTIRLDSFEHVARSA